MSWFLMGSNCRYFGGAWFTVVKYIGNDKMAAVPFVWDEDLRAVNDNTVERR
jgi:hypothetical protein